MKRNIIFMFLLSLIISACTLEDKYKPITGFWEGPHPVAENENFVVHIFEKNDTLKANAYWTRNNFYNGSFTIDSVRFIEHNLVFLIPNWNCTYRGTLNEDSVVNGYFSCINEPDDSVQLVRKDELKKYLISDYDNPDFKYEYKQPGSTDDELATSKYQKSDSVFIATMIQEIINKKYGRINSFLVLKDQKLICEEYFYGYTQNTLHQIESCTKSITSLLVGIAKDKGYIKDLNEPIYKIFPDQLQLRINDSKKITIKDLLTMRAGFDLQQDELFFSDNKVDYALNRELIHTPGEEFMYDGGSTEILGAIIKEKTRLFADNFAKDNLFDPLRITNYNWEIFKQNEYPCMGGSLQLIPRDMIKIGLLVLNKGKWNDEQIISEEWIEESTSVHTKTHIESDDYGYQWWKIKAKVNDNSSLKSDLSI